MIAKRSKIEAAVGSMETWFGLRRDLREYAHRETARRMFAGAAVLDFEVDNLIDCHQFQQHWDMEGTV